MERSCLCAWRGTFYGCVYSLRCSELKLPDLYLLCFSFHLHTRDLYLDHENPHWVLINTVKFQVIIRPSSQTSLKSWGLWLSFWALMRSQVPAVLTLLPPWRCSNKQSVFQGTSSLSVHLPTRLFVWETTWGASALPGWHVGCNKPDNSVVNFRKEKLWYLFSSTPSLQINGI